MQRNIKPAPRRVVQRSDLWPSRAQADDETDSVTAELKTLQDGIAALRKARRFSAVFFFQQVLC